MKLYSQEEALENLLGAKGTKLSDEYESNVEEFLIGESIKKARLANHLTQEQLGEMIGVHKAQICKIENGSNLTIKTIAKIFKAMSIKAELHLDGIGKVMLN